MKLLPHQQRVVDETHQLADRLKALAGFLVSALFKTLPEDEQVLLIEQSKLMTSLLDVLCKRMQGFAPQTAEVIRVDFRKASAA